MSFLVDTNIFNKLLDGTILLESLPTGCPYVATHIQIDEINNTSNAGRRAQLFLMFAKVSPKIIPTESFVFDISRWGECKWSDGVLHNKLKRELDSLNNSKANNTNDVLIAEVAIVSNYTLITADKHLADLVKDNLGQSIYLDYNTSI